MSTDLTRRDFELWLDEFVRDELDADRRRACERYLADHADARNTVAEARRLLLDPAWFAAGAPPAGLLERSIEGVERRLNTADSRALRPTHASRSWRPALAWVSAAAAVLVGAMLLWPSGAQLVFADVVARLQQVESVRVEGWIRVKDGRQVPYRQWLLADGTFRAEVGEPGHERVVVLRDGERRVRDGDGRLYTMLEEPGSAGRWNSLRATLQHIEALSRDGSLAARSSLFTSKVLGPITRFTRRDRAPVGDDAGRLQWTLDVDNDTSLPLVSSRHERLGGDWIAMSELRFTGFDDAFDGSLFALLGAAQPVDDDARTRLWFELAISPASLVMPTVSAPDGDGDVEWYGPADMPAGTSSGGYTQHQAGVSTFGLYNLSLDNLVRGVTGLPVADDAAARQQVSLRLRTKTVLPWPRQLAPVLEHLHLRAEEATRSVSRQRYVFRQGGRPLTPSRAEFPLNEIRGDVDGTHYRLEKYPLSAVIEHLLGNSSLRRAAHDTVVFDGGDGSGADPFAVEVDAVFHNPDRSWETNLAYLRSEFGVTLDKVAEEVSVREIRLVEDGKP